MVKLAGRRCDWGKVGRSMYGRTGNPGSRMPRDSSSGRTAEGRVGTKPDIVNREAYGSWKALGDARQEQFNQ